MPAGRPKIELSSLPSNWKESVLELYREGASDVEIRGLLADFRIEGTFSIDLFDRLLSENSEFSETIKIGRNLSRIWWEKNGRSNLQNRDFNYTGWYMNMRNRFKDEWNAESKQEVKHSGSISSNNFDSLPPAEKRKKLLEAAKEFETLNDE